MGHLVTLDPLAATSLLWTAGAGVEKLLHLGLISATRWRGLALDRTGLLLAVRADRFSFLFAASKTLFNAVSCCREIRLTKISLHCNGIIFETAGLEASCKCGTTRRAVFSPQSTGFSSSYFPSQVPQPTCSWKSGGDPVYIFHANGRVVLQY